MSKRDLVAELAELPESQKTGFENYMQLMGKEYCQMYFAMPRNHKIAEGIHEMLLWASENLEPEIYEQIHEILSPAVKELREEVTADI